MLSIGKLGTGQEMYYLEKVAEGAEDYYSGEGEVAGEWMGDAARELELSGEVGGDQLTAMLTGHNPVDGSQLLGRQGVPGRGSVPGFDLTFSAPKSVSLAWALGGPEVGQAVMDAHHRSVGAALDYMQREACWTRRGAGGAEFVPGNGYIYEANLRHELTRSLGVQWQEVRKGIAEIEGFADSHLREFSTRRAEILEAAGGPQASGRAREVATLATRGAKEREVAPEALHERWRARAEEIGLDREAIGRALGPPWEARRRREAAATAEHRTVSSWQVDRAVTAAASHFDRRDAIQAAAGLLRDGAPATDLERIAEEFLASDAVVPIGQGRRASGSPPGASGSLSARRSTLRRRWPPKSCGRRES